MKSTCSVNSKAERVGSKTYPKLVLNAQHAG